MSTTRARKGLYSAFCLFFAVKKDPGKFFSRSFWLFMPVILKFFLLFPLPLQLLLLHEPELLPRKS